MSYILDALRKADSDRERERGAVPNLHAQAGASGAAVVSDDEERGGPPALMWAVIGLSVLVVGLLGWMLLGRDGASPAPVAPAAPAAPVAPPALSMQPPVAPQPVVANAPLPSTTPQPAPAPVMPPMAAPPAAPLPSPTAQVDPPPDRARALSVPAPPVAPQMQATAPRPDARVLSVEELPDEVRRQLPNLMVNGSKYSDAPASRILIVNGQVFHEGDRLTPELTLEQIQIKEAVLRFRGYRYALRF